MASAQANTTVPNTCPTLSTAIQAKQRFISNVLTEKPTSIYRLDDFKEIRKQLFNNVANAITERYPLYNDRYTLSLEDIGYTDPEYYTIKQQKKALLEGKSLTRRLRGTWVLRDTQSGDEVSRSQRMTLMKVPYMTDRGTFIRNGHEYSFTNIMRLEPGVYTKQRENEITAQFNVKKGTGAGFNMKLQPDTGIMQVSRGTANAPAYTVFKDMGISDDAMRSSWGDELFQKNKLAGEGEKARLAADKIYNM